MNILERIEKKLDKESDSRKMGSQKTPERKIISRSICRHHRHSPKQSNKETHSSSSPSPTKNHRRSRVDEMKGEMNKIKPPTFDGEYDQEDEIFGMRKYFQL
jgi:hypothetical protein